MRVGIWGMGMANGVVVSFPGAKTYIALMVGGSGEINRRKIWRSHVTEAQNTLKITTSYAVYCQAVTKRKWRLVAGTDLGTAQIELA